MARIIAMVVTPENPGIIVRWAPGRSPDAFPPALARVDFEGGTLVPESSDASFPVIPLFDRGPGYFKVLALGPFQCTVDDAVLAALQSDQMHIARLGLAFAAPKGERAVEGQDYVVENVAPAMVSFIAVASDLGR